MKVILHTYEREYLRIRLRFRIFALNRLQAEMARWINQQYEAKVPEPAHVRMESRLRYEDLQSVISTAELAYHTLKLDHEIDLDQWNEWVNTVEEYDIP